MEEEEEAERQGNYVSLSLQERVEYHQLSPHLFGDQPTAKPHPFTTR
jgi:hypothetical protein